MDSKTPILFPLLILVLCVLGCSKLTGSGGKEVVYAPTEVGTPVGDNVTKDIGPAGGTLSSPDGKLTLTVPPNAVAGTVAFSIQPITNQAANGLGLAYRLGPDGQTFTTPVDVSIRIEEKDLEGTVPEALSMAYQDKKGAWHAQTSTKIDQSAKTISFATTHFTDVAAWTRLMLRPVEARVRVGRTQDVRLVQCRERGLIDWLLSEPEECTGLSPNATVQWSHQGPGSIEESSIKSVVNYRAPARKPADNVAYVHVRTAFGVRNQETGETRLIEKTLTATMTIVDVGYKAIGSSGNIRWSGTVCDFQKPFNILGQAPQLTFVFRLTPSADGASGTASVSGGGHGVTLHSGNGTYTVSGIDAEQPTITLNMESFKGSYPGVGTAEGSGTRLISLVPIEGNECDGS